MKKIALLLLALPATLLIFSACENMPKNDQNVEINEPLGKAISFVVEKNVLVQVANSRLKDFPFEKYKDFGVLDFNLLQETTYANQQGLFDYTIPFKAESKILKILWINGDIQSFILESQSKFAENKNGFTGKIVIRNLDDIIIEEIIENNVTVSTTYNNFSSSGSRNLREGENACYSCVNSHYQDSKDKCEADAICDMFCEPAGLACKATFLVSAVATCTSSGKQPCNPFNG